MLGCRQPRVFSGSLPGMVFDYEVPYLRGAWWQYNLECLKVTVVTTFDELCITRYIHNVVTSMAVVVVG